MGGPLATAGWLVFIAAAQDAFLRAFDADTGKELWRGTLPAAARACPTTYRTRTGAQFVAIVAGGRKCGESRRLGGCVPDSVAVARLTMVARLHVRKCRSGSFARCVPLAAGRSRTASGPWTAVAIKDGAGRDCGS